MEFFPCQSYHNVTDKCYKLNIVLLIVTIAESNRYSSYIILLYSVMLAIESCKIIVWKTGSSKLIYHAFM